MRQMAGAAVTAACGGRIPTVMAVVGAAIVLGLALPAAGAVASPNNSPTTSTPFGIGVPFSGNWPGTVVAHGHSYNHWWRTPTVLRPGDSLQLAVDNRLGTETVSFCLLPPVDGFDADNVLEDKCNSDDNFYVPPERQDRAQMTYGATTGQAHLVAYRCCYSVGSTASGGGQYTVVVERIVTRVVPGLVVPSLIPATFTVSSAMVYGDNAPVTDGTGARLEWRYRAERGRTPSPFIPLADAFSVGGAATFTGTLPPEAQGRAVQLRVCAGQPGGDTAVCTAEQNTVVQAGPNPACVAAKSLRAKRSRAVSKWKGKLRVAQTRRGKRAAKRKLRVAKQRLAAARRGVRSNC